MTCDMKVVLPCPALPVTMCKSPSFANCTPAWLNVQAGGVYGFAKLRNLSSISASHQFNCGRKFCLSCCAAISSAVGNGGRFDFSCSSFIVPFIFFRYDDVIPQYLSQLSLLFFSKFLFHIVLCVAIPSQQIKSCHSAFSLRACDRHRQHYHEANLAASLAI